MQEIFAVMGTVVGGFVGYYLKHVKGMKILENEREKNIIEVITHNTEAMTGVKEVVNSLKSMLITMDNKINGRG